jgi:hypothetical protein
MADIARILARLKHLEAERATWEPVWQSIAEYVLPNRADFAVQRGPGQERTQKLYDMTAVHANEMLASALHAMLTNPALHWFTLRTYDEKVNVIRAVRAWLEDAQTRMEAVFSSPRAGFTPAIHEFYLDLGAPGTAVMLVEERGRDQILFRTHHLAECMLAEGETGRIDTIYRKFKMTARQLAQRFETLPEKIANALAGDKPDQEFEIVHAVEPRADYDGRRLDGRNMPWRSCYVALQDKAELSEGGYQEFPFVAARWSKVAGETYGRSPSWTALPDIKMVNAMSRTVLRAAQKATDPPLLLSDEGIVLPVRTTPGGLNFGAVDGQGRELMKPLVTGARIDIGLEMQEQRREQIRHAFFVDQLQFFNDQRMTATEVLQRTEERLRLMSPMVGRMQIEGLGPLVERVFSIMLRRGQFLPPPLELRGQEIKIEYVSPIAKAQRASDLVAMSRGFELLAPYAAANPAALDVIDGDELVRAVADLSSFPLKVVRDARALAAVRAGRQQAIEAASQRQDIGLAADVAGKVMKGGQRATA